MLNVEAQLQQRSGMYAKGGAKECQWTDVLCIAPTEKILRRIGWAEKVRQRQNKGAQILFKCWIFEEERVVGVV